MYEHINPLGKQLYHITRQYVGVLAHLLDDCELDRYYYPMWVIGQGNDCYTQQQVADILGVDKVVVTRIVDHLEKNGLITRCQNPDDRRAYNLVVTEKGRLILPTIEAAFEYLNSAAFEGFSPEQVTLFLKQIKTIRKNLSEKHAEEIVIEFERLKSKIAS